MLKRRDIVLGTAALTAAACASTRSNTPRPPPKLLVDIGRAPDEDILLWPDGAPGGDAVDLSEHYVSRKNIYDLPDRAAFDVTAPALSVFRPARPTGASLLLIPGGGYRYVVIEKEGYEGARYFNQHGFTCYVLKYRLPHQGWTAGPDTPLQDAQRAVRLIRARVARDGNLAGHITAMGFSAGGHVCGSLCQKFDAPTYEPVDNADTVSARPDLGALIYPVALMRGAHVHRGSREKLLGTSPTSSQLSQYDLSAAPNPAGPPLFLLHTLEDTSVPAENALELASACRRTNVPASLHVFEGGAHGFGFRGIDGTPLSKWPELVVDWIRNHRRV